MADGVQSPLNRSAGGVTYRARTSSEAWSASGHATLGSRVTPVGTDASLEVPRPDVSALEEHRNEKIAVTYFRRRPRVSSLV